MATLEQFRRRVGAKIGLAWNTAGDEQTLIDGWLNDAVRDVLMRTACHLESATMDTTAEEWQYTLSSSVLQVREIWRDGETTRMYRSTPNEILEYRRMNVTPADPGSVRWALMGNNILLLWPTPTSAYTISILYIPRPAELSFNTHDPSDPTYGGVPVEFHPAIESYAAWKAADYADDESSRHGQAYLEEYLMLVGQARKDIVMKGGARLSPIMVGRHPRRAGIPSTPGTDTGY